MTDLDPDQETRRAVRALAARIRDRDAADYGDQIAAEAFAHEYVTALRAHGWRPTLARPAPSWQAAHGPPAAPDTVHQRAEEIRAAIRSLEARF